MTTTRTFLFAALLATSPAAAFAADEHPAGHDMSEHSMPQEQPMHGAREDSHDSAAGEPGDPAKVTRVIEITMHDTMRYTPSRIEVKRGETVRFFLRNEGKLRHETVIGSMEELKEHAALMRTMPNMHHAEPNMISLAPGQRGSIVWRFGRPGVVPFACLQPGHMEAGMVGEVEAK